MAEAPTPAETENRQEAETFARWKAVLEYFRVTGNLTWLPRAPARFKTATDCNAWNARFAGQVAGTLDPSGYIRIRMGSGSYLAHRVAWLLVHEKWPEGQIDHINGDRADNRLTNLRAVSASDNRRNMRLGRRNRSGVMGVCWDKSRGLWMATIKIDGRSRTLGRFEHIEDAIAARAHASAEYGFHENHGRAA